MRAIPEELKASEKDLITGVSCLECPGVLRARREGSGADQIRFTCRIGHVYSTDELIAGKERALEESFWAVLLCVEELEALLADFDGMKSDPTSRHVAYAERVRRLHATAAELRALVERNEPVDLGGRGTSERASGLPR